MNEEPDQTETLPFREEAIQHSMERNTPPFEELNRVPVWIHVFFWLLVALFAVGLLGWFWLRNSFLGGGGFGE